MDALAHDLRTEVPDLAGQFEESRPSVRRNTGFGLFTEMIVDRSRPVPASGPTGDLGSVHAMVGDLADPIAFRVRVRQGVLLGLIGDSYGQDTRAIDFASVPFDQVFTIDDQGRSVPFEPRPVEMRALHALQRHEDPFAEPEAPPPPPRLHNVGPLEKLQEPSEPALVEFDLRRGGRTAAAEAAAAPAPLAEDEKIALRVGVWFGLFVLASVLVLIFEAPIPAAFAAAILAGRLLQTDRGLDLLRRTTASLQQAARERQA